mgnify:CR=1 FL=1
MKQYLKRILPLAGAILILCLPSPTARTVHGIGMGTAALIGQIGVLDAMGYTTSVYLGIALLHIMLPLGLMFALDFLFRRKGLLSEGDFKL